MKLIDLLQLIDDTAKEKGLSTPFVCGGIPRDKVINKIKFNDIDITTGDQDIHFLAKEVYFKLKKFNATYVTGNDGHVSIFFQGVKIDFSSNFIVPKIEEITKMKISSIHQELLSRDFTCNALLMSMDLKKIYDPLRKGIKAIHAKEIDTCLDPEITLRLDPNRIIRAIYLSSKLNFRLSKRVKNWIIANKEIIYQVKPKYIVEKINKAMRFNQENTIKLIKELEIENIIPLNYVNFKGTL